jgi:hypothetical protein
MVCSINTPFLPIVISGITKPIYRRTALFSLRQCPHRFFFNRPGRRFLPVGHRLLKQSQFWLFRVFRVILNHAESGNFAEKKFSSRPVQRTRERPNQNL